LDEGITLTELERCNGTRGGIEGMRKGWYLQIITEALNDSNVKQCPERGRQAWGGAAHEEPETYIRARFEKLIERQTVTHDVQLREVVNDLINPALEDQLAEIVSTNGVADNLEAIRGVFEL
jgi:hypothetical protein